MINIETDCGKGTGSGSCECTFHPVTTLGQVIQLLNDNEDKFSYLIYKFELSENGDAGEYFQLLSAISIYISQQIVALIPDVPMDTPLIELYPEFEGTPIAGFSVMVCSEKKHIITPWEDGTPFVSLNVPNLIRDCGTDESTIQDLQVGIAYLPEGTEIRIYSMVGGVETMILNAPFLIDANKAMDVGDVDVASEIANPLEFDEGLNYIRVTAQIPGGELIESTVYDLYIPNCTEVLELDSAEITCEGDEFTVTAIISFENIPEGSFAFLYLTHDGNSVDITNQAVSGDVNGFVFSYSLAPDDEHPVGEFVGVHVIIQYPGGTVISSDTIEVEWESC